MCRSLPRFVAFDDQLRIGSRYFYLVALDVGIGRLFFDDLAMGFSLAGVPAGIVALLQVFAHLAGLTG